MYHLLIGLCVVRIMLYAQEGNGILLSFNQPCTDHVGKLPVCNNSKKPKEQIYSLLYFMMIYCYMRGYMKHVIYHNHINCGPYLQRKTCDFIFTLPLKFEPLWL